MSSYTYNTYIDRAGGAYDVVTDYYIDPYYDPESFEVFSHTQWSLTFTPLGQPTTWLAGGEAEESGWVSWPIGFSSGPLPAQGVLSFEAVNPWTTERVSYSLAITDAAMVVDAVTIAGGDEADLIMLGSGDDRAAGGDGNDVIDAWLGDDLLRGGDGDDRLDGGEGADRMLGGAGHDQYFVDSQSDQVIELADGGVDTITSSVSLKLVAHVEALTLLGIADLTGWGNADSNQINGNMGRNVLRGLNGNDGLAGREGDDRLIGGAGDDILDGGAGNDWMIGGSGNDAYVIDSAGDRFFEAEDGGIDTVYAGFTRYELGETVENLTLMAYDAIGVGNVGDNLIIGGYGADLLRGRGGDDILSGYTGMDRLRGDRGADVFRFDDNDSAPSARDTIVDFSRAEGDRVDLTWIGGLTFRGEDGFSGAGHEIAVTYAHGDTFVNVDLGLPGVTSLSIRLLGTIELTATDFVL